MQDSTITLSADYEPEAIAISAHPQLIVIGVCDKLAEPSSRHLLDDVDEVRFGRGPRRHGRTILDGKRILELRIPDDRMSGDHGRLLRVPGGWLIDDPNSKNGAIIDGVPNRHQAVGHDCVIELGHTFLLLRGAPIEPGAADDVYDDGLVAGTPMLATFDGELAERLTALVRIAPTEVSVMLQGETGTGKEVVARALHDLSGRKGVLVAVNCGALPPALVEAELFGAKKGAYTGSTAERTGYVRSADKGTLFLDEVGELPHTSQAAFLRVLQEREVVPVGGDKPISVDVRLCSATLRNVDQLVASGALRQDLYARLFGFTLLLPPLRDRLVDLGLLMRRMLATIPNGASVKIAPTAMRALLDHGWPLNIRELHKVLATAVALCDGTIELGHLGEVGKRATPDVPMAPPHTGDELYDRIVTALTNHNGNVLAAAKEMSVRRTQLYRWIARYRIVVDDYRGGRRL